MPRDPSLPLYGRSRRRRLAPEASLQIAVVEHLRLRGCRGLLFFHPCNEGRRSEAAGLTLKRMGMLPGIADLVIYIPGQPLAFLELKAVGKTLSSDQAAFREWCIDTGRRYGVVHNVEDALSILRLWGALEPRRATV